MARRVNQLVTDWRRRTAGSVAWETISVQSETTSRTNWYRGRAADCLALTEQAPTDPANAMLADMAAKWLRLAELVHRWEGDDSRGRTPEASCSADVSHAVARHAA